MYNENKILTELKLGSYDAFTVLFKKYYKDFVIFAGNFLQEKHVSEDIVQNVFLQLWANRETLNITSSLKSFLLRSVQNACLDELRHKKIVREHVAFIEVFGKHSDSFTENYVLYSEIESHIQNAIDSLPDDYKTAFEMHRNDGLKYREIADKLQLTERAVEGRIARSLKILRKALNEFVPKILLLFFS